MGVMENWGLVTYAETFLLVDEKLSSYEIKADAARAICHVLSNHWFGSLVTMAWWTGLWLSERFAQFDAAHHIYPELKLWDTFVQDVMLGSAEHPFSSGTCIQYDRSLVVGQLNENKALESH
ncbi:metalloprotease family [Plasmopara halstedii]|uniref:Metalloprotease family n=1 Tax=Plasmopara halstedii TaxID=4781 RepID=A0A0P1B1R1_PLAHL|nr:metalloprotease family [Plasmopara halstedii]CEG47925.1 metalloprotease family [Plasmopara halstedii]|eukprot:XP_024584294.1 metalloprotease family [Plasmopara halstedii]